MLRCLAVLLPFVVAACGKSGTMTIVSKGPAPAAQPAPAPATPTANAPAPNANANANDDADCNLQTKLVPGVPGSPGHLVKSTRNPNGDSELAVLMRQFVEDLREVRTLVEAKQPVKKLLPTHRKMRCAWMTAPEERNEAFDTRAQAYLAAVRAFDAAPSQATYNGIVAGCISCHAQSCGGPLDFIDGMKWE